MDFLKQRGIWIVTTLIILSGLYYWTVVDQSRLEDMSDLRDTNPSQTYIKICNEFKNNPPSNNWDGVYTFKSK